MLVVKTATVYPSAAEFLRASIATAPSAPGLLSTTIAFPSLSDIFCATKREVMVVPPPGANPTSQCIGFDGKVAEPDPTARSVFWAFTCAQKHAALIRISI